MTSSGEKDGFGDRLRAAERARENLYFAKIDEELLAKIRADQKKPHEEAKAGRGDCPRCEEPLRSGLWREIEIEFCPGCRGVWLDQGDLLELARSQDVDLRLGERSGERSKGA